MAEKGLSRAEDGLSVVGLDVEHGSADHPMSASPFSATVTPPGLTFGG